MCHFWLNYVTMCSYVCLVIISSKFQYLLLINYAVRLLYFSCMFLIFKISFCSGIVHFSYYMNVMSSHITARISVSTGKFIKRSNSEGQAAPVRIMALPLMAVSLWVTHCISLCLSFLTWKMKIVVIHTGGRWL